MSQASLVRGLHWAIAVIAVVAAIVGAIPFNADGSHLVRLGRWLVRELVPGVVTFAVVGLIVLRSPKARAVGWVMLSSAAAWGLSVLCAGLYAGGQPTRCDTGPFGHVAHIPVSLR